jgi:hypothetical protein
MDQIYTHKSGAELWQGNIHDVNKLIRKGNSLIKVIGLFAQECQPNDPYGHYELIKMGYDDNTRAGNLEMKRILSIAVEAANIFSNRIREGKSCLSSCYMGLNRSGLVSALTLIKLANMSPDEAITMIQNKREPQHGMTALCNPRFVNAIRNVSNTIGSKSTYTEWYSKHR